MDRAAWHEVHLLSDKASKIWEPDRWGGEGGGGEEIDPTLASLLSQGSVQDIKREWVG